MKALHAIHSADVSALLTLFAEYHAILSKQFPQLPAAGERFLQLRKTFVQTQLELLEESSPGLAGKLQETLDEYCKLYPFGYE